MKTRRVELGKLARFVYMYQARSQKAPPEDAYIGWFGLTEEVQESYCEIAEELFRKGVESSDEVRAERAVRSLEWSPDAFYNHLNMCSPIALRKILEILDRMPQLTPEAKQARTHTERILKLIWNGQPPVIP